MNRPDFTVATLGDLATLYTADIAEGANTWVIADGSYWTLEKNSGAPIGPTVIAPLGGAPSAGATNARWIREAGVPSANAILQVVVAPNLATDYSNTTNAFTDIISQPITLTTGTRVLAVANAFGRLSSSQLKIVEGANLLASGGPQYAIESVPGPNMAVALQGHESALVPGSTYVFKLQGACDALGPPDAISIAAFSNPGHGHASLTLYELT